MQVKLMLLLSRHRSLAQMTMATCDCALWRASNGYVLPKDRPSELTWKSENASNGTPET